MLLMGLVARRRLSLMYIGLQATELPINGPRIFAYTEYHGSRMATRQDTRRHRLRFLKQTYVTSLSATCASPPTPIRPAYGRIGAALPCSALYLVIQCGYTFAYSSRHLRYVVSGFDLCWPLAPEVLKPTFSDYPSLDPRYNRRLTQLTTARARFSAAVVPKGEGTGSR